MNPVSSIPWYDFNFLDYVLIAIVVISVLLSFSRGFIKEIISLCIWIAGVILALKFAPLLELRIQAITNWGLMSYLLGFIVIFLAVWLVGLFIHLAIRSVVSRTGVSFADRVIGGCFGIVRGLLAVSVLLMFIGMSPYNNVPTVHGSRIVPDFNRAVAILDNYVPENMRHFTHWSVGGK